MKIGLSLPHFSNDCDRNRLIEFVPQTENSGFSSFWVRDHVNFRPGAYDPPGNHFVDAFITLAALSSVTTHAHLGFSVIVPFRNPVMTAQMLGSLDWISGGRVEIGYGVGGGPHQFAALNIDTRQRGKRITEIAEVVAASAGGATFSFTGPIHNVADVTISPGIRPDIPKWYGGLSEPALRRAAKYCDGVLPARTSFRKIEPALAELNRFAAEHGRGPMLAGSAPFVSIARTREAAIAQVADKLRKLRVADGLPASDDLLDGLEGAVVIGSPDDCVEQLCGFVHRGFDTVVLDPRLLMYRFEETISMFADEVLPRINGSD